MERRKFIQKAAAGSTAWLLSSLETAAGNTPFFTDHTASTLQILATNWGFEGDYDSFFAKIKKEGYDGAEIWLPGNEQERNELSSAAKKYDMALGLLYGDSNKDPQKNFKTFKENISLAARLQPLYINCHTARDFFSFEQLQPFFEFTIALSKQTGISVYHETHRGRALYSAPVTKYCIDKIPELRITADLSHWCVVHESLLEDQEETLNAVLERSDHIHARIGHAEGPQVNDPRAPEWEYAVKKHFEWWDRIVERKKKTGERITILTEFGPPDYMATLPYTRQPLSDQWAINVHMLKLLRKRYS